MSWDKGIPVYPALEVTVTPFCSHPAHPWALQGRNNWKTGAEDTSHPSYEDLHRAADFLGCIQKFSHGSCPLGCHCSTWYHCSKPISIALSKPRALGAFKAEASAYAPWILDMIMDM